MQSKRKQKPVRKQPTADTAPETSRSLRAHHPSEEFLIQVAAQSGTGDPDHCTVVLNLMSAARSVRRLLSSTVGVDALTEPKVVTLLTLHALEPAPCTPADLAYYAEVSRSNMTDVLDDLQERGWIIRPPRPGDRRYHPVQLTYAGQQAAQITVKRFLQMASLLAADLTTSSRRALIAGCEVLRERAQTSLAH